MPESLRDVIEDIQKKLKANAYQNEEHVRLSLVARVVQALGWDIWNPGEVNAEYKATSNEDNTKVDLTLHTAPRSAAVFIEIKDVGKLTPNLSVVENQMKGYLRNYSAPFCILTDGQYWRFYFVYADRIEFSDKCFRKMNLLADSLEDLELGFDAYLAKVKHLNGQAKSDAESEMAMTDRERRIWECLPEAQSRINANPLLSLVEALILVACEKHRLDVTQAEALKCIQEGQGVISPVSIFRPPAPKVVASSPSPAKEISPPKINGNGGNPGLPTQVLDQGMISFRLDGVRYQVKSPVEIVVTVAEYLISKNRLNASTAPVPWVGARNWFTIVNHEPKHTDGRLPQRKRQLSNGLWLMLPTDKWCMEAAQRLLKRFELEGVLSSDGIPLPDSAIEEGMNSNLQISGLVSPSTDAKSSQKPPRRPVSIKLNGKLLGITKANQILVATAEFLIENGKLQKSNVPISMGGSSYLVNLEPRHSSGTEFHHKRQLSNGLWLNINFNATNCEEQAKKLIEYFGMKRDILQVVWQG